MQLQLDFSRLAPVTSLEASLIPLGSSSKFWTPFIFSKMDSFKLTLIVLVIHTVNFAASNNLTESEIFAYDVPVQIQDEFLYFLSGYDEDGAPIWILEPGKWDMRKYVEEGGKLYDAMDIFIDRMYLTFRDSGLNSTAKQFKAICDMTGFSIRQAGDVKTVQFMLSKFVRFEQIARSGSMKEAWIVNANALFEKIWQIGSRSWGTLAESVEVFGTNQEFWKPKLLKKLPRDQIPELYGGLPNHKPLMVIG